MPCLRVVIAGGDDSIAAAKLPSHARRSILSRGDGL